LHGEGLDYVNKTMWPHSLVPQPINAYFLVSQEYEGTIMKSVIAFEAS